VLLDDRTDDGSRKFAELPECHPFELLRDHIASLRGAVVTDFLTDGTVEVWIDFALEGEEFTVNNQLGEFWFFVKNPDAPDALLHRVVKHCARLLNRS